MLPFDLFIYPGVVGSTSCAQRLFAGAGDKVNPHDNIKWNKSVPGCDVRQPSPG